MAKYKIVFDPTLANGDSLAAYLTDAAGAVLTSTLVGSDQSLDINVTQSVLPAGAATEATLATRASEATLATRASEATLATRASEATVASILSEIAALSFADGSIWAASSMGISSLAVRKDAAGALTGVADGDWTPLIVDSNGALKVTATVTFGGEYAEDSVATTGDTGLFTLAVRRDVAGSQVSAAGDYAEFQVGGTGELRTMRVDGTAVLQSQTTLAVAGTAQPVPAIPLVNRKKLWVQNISDKPQFFGSATVSVSGATRGYEIDNGGSEMFECDDNVVLYGVCGSNTKNVVTLEFS